MRNAKKATLKNAIEKEQKFCPDCGSIDLKMVVNPAKVESALFQEMHCNKCGREGFIIIGKENARKAVEKKHRKNN